MGSQPSWKLNPPGGRVSFHKKNKIVVHIFNLDIASWSLFLFHCSEWGVTLKPSNGWTRQYILKLGKPKMMLLATYSTGRASHVWYIWILKRSQNIVWVDLHTPERRCKTSDPTQVLVHLAAHLCLTMSWKQLVVVSLGYIVLVVDQNQQPQIRAASQETSFSRARDTCEVVKKD